MQANELRIGNWVKVKHTGHYVQIGHRDIGYITEGSDNYAPIPFTPEILEECGFQDLGMYDNDGSKVNNCWVMPYKRTFETESRQNVMVVPYEKEILGYAFGVENIENDFRIAICRITELHQLQNLFHSLTNTELQWNRKQ